MEPPAAPWTQPQNHRPQNFLHYRLKTNKQFEIIIFGAFTPGCGLKVRDHASFLARKMEYSEHSFN